MKAGSPGPATTYLPFARPTPAGGRPWRVSPASVPASDDLSQRPRSATSTHSTLCPPTTRAAPSRLDSYTPSPDPHRPGPSAATSVEIDVPDRASRGICAEGARSCAPLPQNPGDTLYAPGADGRRGHRLDAGLAVPDRAGAGPPAIPIPHGYGTFGTNDPGDMAGWHALRVADAAGRFKDVLGRLQRRPWTFWDVLGRVCSQRT